jgi:filamentous hemagglutinin
LIAFAAAGFNLIGDLTEPEQWDLKDGGLAKIGMHAVMGGLAAEAAGGDFKTGALAAGLNEALVDSLAKQYADMPKEKRDSLLVMNSQLIGVLAAATQSDADAESLQTGAWVAGNATQYNYLTHQDVQDMLAKQAKCASDECKNQIREDYANLDESRNKQLASTCQNAPQLCETISARLAADDPKLLELAKQASANGDMGAATVIAYVVRNSNQDAQNTIATELAALKNGDDGTKFLAQLGATLLSAVTGGGAKAPGAKEVPQVKWSAQEKHFPGHNSYTPGRSVLASDPRKLAESAGSGVQVGDIPVGLPGSKERVSFGGTIGTYIDRAGVATPTSNGIIHYSKDGIHIVPARP